MGDKKEEQEKLNDCATLPDDDLQGVSGGGAFSSIPRVPTHKIDETLRVNAQEDAFTPGV